VIVLNDSDICVQTHLEWQNEREYVESTVNG
jgi:hypothetical protein